MSTLKAAIFLACWGALVACGVVSDATAFAQQGDSGLAAWPKAHTMTFWTRNTPYTGPVQDVFIGDNRSGAPPGYPRAAAYTNLWSLRAEWEYDPRVLDTPNTFHLEKQKYDIVSTAIVATGTGGVADGYDARRKLLDCRKPETQRWIRSEAKRLVDGGFTRVFFDNTQMKVTGFYQPVAGGKALRDADNVASMAAGTKAFRDECQRLGKPMEMIINLAFPWHWENTPGWEKAYPKVVDYWWDLGVRGILLEKPEARPPDSAGYQCNLAVGKAWLAKGGNLYVILEDEPKGVALAREWDSAKTWVYDRTP
jgi:hypothetical protein